MPHVTIALEGAKTATGRQAALRSALKRCSLATYRAALRFRKTRSPAYLPALVHGLLERYVSSELRAKFGPASHRLRLREDLGLDSLTMMELVMVAEEVLQVSISNDDLPHLRTVGDLQEYLTRYATAAK
ncbi:MAG TPA: acyl carrier protein [Opitutaceae bacterium]|nr:acyl carrier protein [Opitutaceae bacterium]